MGFVSDGPRFGGATANYACHASILGGEVFMVSGVGKDDRGQALLKVYQKHEVNTELIQEVNDFPTGIVTVELEGFLRLERMPHGITGYGTRKLNKKSNPRMLFILEPLVKEDNLPEMAFVKP